MYTNLFGLIFAGKVELSGCYGFSSGVESQDNVVG